jgi:hypothetical protein
MTIIINGTTGISGVDGSASVPALKGNDADTGIFYPTANEVAASAGSAPVWNASSSFGFKNRIINGAMVIDQRNAGASVTPVNAQYTLDRWVFELSQANKFTVQQDAGAVTPPAGFTDYLGITVGASANVTVASSDFFALEQRIEGFNIADLNWGTANAKTITLSFWVRSSLTGTFGGALGNGGTRSYPFTYTISSANTWEQKSVTIAGDTTGTWNTGNGWGIGVFLSIGMGSTRLNTANAWAAGNFLSATGSTNLISTNSATFYVTGLQFEVGTVATSFDFRDYGRELIMCQRYYEQSAQSNDYIWLGYCSSGSGYYLSVPFKVNKRAVPTVTVSSPGAGAFNTATLTAGDLNTDKFNAICTANATSVGGFFYTQFKASAEL